MVLDFCLFLFVIGTTPFIANGESSSDHSMNYSGENDSIEYSFPVYDFSTDDFSITDDFSTDDFSITDDFSMFSNDYDFSIMDDDFSISSSPTPAPSFTLEANQRTMSCYSDCSYPGMTIPPKDWTEEEYCAFYQSTTCSKTSVSSYSCVPSCLSDCSDVFCDSMSALVFACDATVHGATYKNKTAVELSCLDSFSTNAPSETEMSFTSLTEFDNVSPSEMNTTAGMEAAIAAMSLAMSGVTTDQIKIVSITGSESRRVLSSSQQIMKSHMRKDGVVAQAVSSIVLYQITVVLEKLGYSSSSSTAAFEKLVGQISTSVSSGQFQQNLKAAGQSVGVTTFQSAGVSKTPSYTAPQVIYLTTAAPTPRPTPTPTSSPTKETKTSKNGNNDKDNLGIIVGSVVGGFVFLLLIFCFVYFCLNQQRRAELEATFKRRQFFRVSADDSPRFIATVPSGAHDPMIETRVAPAPRSLLGQSDQEANKLL